MRYVYGPLLLNTARNLLAFLQFNRPYWAFVWNRYTTKWISKTTYIYARIISRYFDLANCYSMESTLIFTSIRVYQNQFFVIFWLLLETMLDDVKRLKEFCHWKLSSRSFDTVLCPFRSWLYGTWNCKRMFCSWVYVRLYLDYLCAVLDQIWCPSALLNNESRGVCWRRELLNVKEVVNLSTQ